MRYIDIKKFVEATNAGLPCLFNNDCGEYGILSQGRDKETHLHFYKLQTRQENGWVRINIYWEDGTVEEMYEKEQTK